MKHKNISKILKNTRYWHGTGRFQYSAEGKRVDVLQDIITNKGLIPALDIWDLTGDMTTTSFAFTREYGLLYANMHTEAPLSPTIKRKQEALVRKYIKGVKQKAIVWWIQDVGIKEAFKKGFKLRRRLKYEHRWSKKINKSQPSIQDSFTVGSDIRGNYPILMGVSKLGKVVKAAPYLSQLEQRSASPTPLSVFTHIEAPKDKVQEIETLFHKHQISVPVLALELVDIYRQEDLV